MFRAADETSKPRNRVFRPAYYIAKSDRPYYDHQDLIDLQELNSVDIGRVLHINVSRSDIIDHIATRMKGKVVDNIVSSKSHFSVFIDESTSLNRSSCLIVYVRTT